MLKNMLEKIFENIGDTLEKIGKFLFCFFFIAGVLYPVVVLLADVWWYTMDIFIGSLIGIPAAFFIALPLFGFGRLINNTNKTTS